MVMANNSPYKLALVKAMDLNHSELVLTYEGKVLPNQSRVIVDDAVNDCCQVTVTFFMKKALTEMPEFKEIENVE